MDICKTDTTVPTTKEEEKKAEEASIFDGTWVLAKNEGSDAYLTTEGIGMLKRNAFKLVNVTMGVKIAGGRINLTVQGSFGKPKTYDAPTDGTDYETTNLQDQAQTRTYKLSADGKQLVATSKPTPTGGMDTRTWAIVQKDGKDTLEISVTNDKGGEMKQIFNKKE